MPGYPQGLAVKVPKRTAVDEHGYMQKANVKFDDEMAILEKVPAGVTGQRLVAEAEGPDGRYLITTFAPGKPSDPVQNPLTAPQVASMVKSLGLLDQAGLLHRDLKPRNWHTTTSETHLFDYGAGVTFDPTDFKTNRETYHFPEFWVPSNLKNYESNGIFRYIFDAHEDGHPLKRAEMRELLTAYLKTSADVHADRARQFVQLLPDLSPADRKTMRQAIDFERLQAELLREPSDDLINLEAARIQVLFATERAYHLEVRARKPLGNITWKLFAMMCARRYQDEAKALAEKAPAHSKLRQYLGFHQKLASYYMNDNAHPWLMGALGHITATLLGQPDLEADQADLLAQLDPNKNQRLGFPHPLDIAGQIEQADPVPSVVRPVAGKHAPSAGQRLLKTLIRFIDTLAGFLQKLSKRLSGTISP